MVKNFLVKGQGDEHVRPCENLCGATFPKIRRSRKQINQCNPGRGGEGGKIAGLKTESVI